MPWTIDDHRASAQEALDRGIISGNIDHLAEVPEPQQSSEHQARVSALSILNQTAGPQSVIDTPWTPGLWTPPAVDPPTDPQWGDGVAFGSRPAADGPIVIRNQTDVVIENLHFEGGAFIWQPGRSHNAHVCIRVIDSTNVTIQNCDAVDISEFVSVEGASSDVFVEHNRVRGIVGPGSRVNEQTGNFLQTTDERIRYVNVLDNKIIATTDTDPWGGAYETMTEDAISFYGASKCIAFRNQIDATGYQRDYGTGIIAGDSYGNGHIVSGNVLVNPGQVGLACAGGHDHVFDDNIIWRDPDQNPGSGNVPAYYWDYNGTGISGGEFVNNRAKWHGGGGFWNPGGAYTEGNDWDDDTLERPTVTL